MSSGASKVNWLAGQSAEKQGKAWCCDGHEQELSKFMWIGEHRSQRCVVCMDKRERSRRFGRKSVVVTSAIPSE